MRKIVLYTYHIDEERFSQTSNLNLERETVDIESRNEHELIFAVSNNNNNMRQTRIAIAAKPGKVFHDYDSATYKVWFDVPDRDKAIEAIGNYILDHVASEIRTHESFIKRLNAERQQAIKLLESLPEE